MFMNNIVWVLTRRFHLVTGLRNQCDKIVSSGQVHAEVTDRKETRNETQED
jgi:hypothetical protein